MNIGLRHTHDVVVGSKPHKEVKHLHVRALIDIHGHTQIEGPANHLLASEKLPLVLVDDGVACGHSPVLVPRHRTQEITGVGQAIGSCKQIGRRDRSEAWLSSEELDGLTKFV